MCERNVVLALGRPVRPAKTPRCGLRKAAGAQGASGSPDYGFTVNAGLGFTLRLLILQLPASGWLLPLKVLVALLQAPYTVLGPQVEVRILKPRHRPGRW